MKIKQFTIAVLILTVSASFTSAQTRQDTIEAYKTMIGQYRAEKDARLMNTAVSPLSADQIQRFQGLSYFPIEYTYNLTGNFIPDDAPGKERLNLSGGGSSRFVKSGRVVFSLDGVEYTLSVYQNNDLQEFAGNPAQLFIPFKDATTGEQSHPNGRYVTITPPEQGNQVTLDFNKAMNPYGAYDSTIPSVLPPPDNVLTIPLPTGERKYDDR